MFGVLVLPFLSVWIYAGFAKALGMVFALGISGVGLLVLAAVINWGFGWAAHYVFTGKMPEMDDLFDATILDEWESYQRAQLKKALHARPNVSSHTPMSKIDEMKADCTQPFGPVPPDSSSGPDWLKHK
jgi:hypothetical protein